MPVQHKTDKSITTVSNDDLIKNLFRMVVKGNCTREVLLNRENMNFYKYRRRDLFTKLLLRLAWIKFT